MRITAINGSPRGREGNTDVLVQTLLTGAAEAGADTETVYLAEKRIEHCRGCHSCRNARQSTAAQAARPGGARQSTAAQAARPGGATPGRCVIDDDMSGVLRWMGAPGLIVLASPVFLANVSGTLKDFIDRLTVTGNPRAAPPPPAGAARSAAPEQPAPPRFVMVSSCGYPGSGQFDVVSLWIHRLAAMMGTRVEAEIYTPQGKTLREPTEEQRPRVEVFLAAAAAAGRALATGGSLTEPEIQKLRAGLTFA